jgi:hypothetical protein
VLNVPPVLLVYVNVLFEYVAPVTLISVGRFWYFAALIVVAVKPFVNIVDPVTVPPVNGVELPLNIELNCCNSALNDEPSGLSVVSPVQTTCINVVGVIADELANVLDVNFPIVYYIYI